MSNDQKTIMDFVNLTQKLERENTELRGALEELYKRQKYHKTFEGGYIAYRTIMDRVERALEVKLKNEVKYDKVRSIRNVKNCPCNQ